MTSPSYITFDLYGTLTAFGMSRLTAELFAERIPADGMESFLDWFEIYRTDEAMANWRPYKEVIGAALERATRKVGVTATEEDLTTIFDSIPTWGPHPDVPEPLARIAEKFPLVILSNADDSQIMSNVDKLGAPFHAVYTAQQAQAYKPRLQAFEYMLDQLGCGPDDIMHVSSSPRYDLQSATDLRIKNTVYVNRGYEPSAPYYHRHEVSDIAGLADLLLG